MWANEVAILFCDGSAWTKVAGKSIPFTARREASAIQSISAGVFVEATLPTVSGEVGANANKITIRRSGDYIVTVNACLIGVSTAASIINTVYRNGSEFKRMYRAPSDGSTNGGGSSTAVFPLTVGDQLDLRVLGVAGASILTEYLAGVSVAMISISEVTKW
jgi:hypothetical protein